VGSRFPGLLRRWLGDVGIKRPEQTRVKRSDFECFCETKIWKISCKGFFIKPLLGDLKNLDYFKNAMWQVFNEQAKFNGVGLGNELDFVQASIKM